MFYGVSQDILKMSSFGKSTFPSPNATILSYAEWISDHQGGAVFVPTRPLGQ
jgi:hypothetical protein